MTFKLQTLEPTVLLVRGYKKPEDIKYCFVCALYRKNENEKWHAHGALSTVGTKGEAEEVFTFLEYFPDGVYTYVSSEDFERFYEKRYFKCIDFTRRKK